MLLPGPKPRGIEQERGVVEPRGGEDFPGPGDLQDKPLHPSSRGRLLMGFTFQSLQASCMCAQQGCCRLGPLKQEEAGVLVLPERVWDSTHWGPNYMPGAPVGWV